MLTFTRFTHSARLMVAFMLLLGGLGLVPRTARAATFTVSSTADSGFGSLRQAILDANASPGADTITFFIVNLPVDITITLASNLPPITEAVTIDGLSAPGASCASWPPTLKVQLNGSQIPTGGRGLLITNNTTIRGLVITGFNEAGIAVANTNNRVQCNLIGTDATGTVARGNTKGVVVQGANNLIGGTTPQERNLISGNTNGVELVFRTSTNRVQGNYIGTDAGGTKPLGNTVVGVVLAGAPTNNLVGGTVPGAGNLISGNGRGVVIQDSGTSNNQVQGNTIGTDVSGTQAVGNGRSGVVIAAGATNNLVGGTTSGAGNLLSGNIGIGVLIQDSGTSNNQVQGNTIGTNRAGTQAVGNTEHGVGIARGATNNLVGGTTSGAGNLVSGNTGSGVLIQDSGTSNNQVQGNTIGTNRAGTQAVGNTQAGVGIARGATNNLVGGTTSGAGNLLSGNGISGVFIQGSGTRNNQVQGNTIGTDVTGTKPLGNTQAGVVITEGAQENLIGGTAAGAGNLIASNANGVVLQNTGTRFNFVLGNTIGTDASGTRDLGNTGTGIALLTGASNNAIGAALLQGGGNRIAFTKGRAGVFVTGTGTVSNAIYSNAIYGSTNLGIDLDGNGVTANDAGDGDGGPNNQQNFPVLTSATNGTIAGTLNSTPSTQFRIEVFANTACDASGYGEGEQLVGATTATTAATGTASFTATYTPVGGKPVLTATATNIATGDTSEFSACRRANVPFSVTTTADGGAGSLRQAILDANATPEADTITFNIPGAGPHTIAPTTPLPTITAPVTIDGLSQPSASCAAWPPTLRIQLDGTNAGAQATGLASSSNTTIQGLVINRFNRAGVVLGAANQLRCSFIGTDVTGTQALGNDVGVFVQTASSTIGGPTPQARNLISGNRSHGLHLTAGATGNQVLGNYIGTDVTGTRDVGNGNGGVLINGGATTNRIGGTTASAGNRIAFNRASGGVSGVAVLQTTGGGNTIQNNAIYTNEGLGIDLGSLGVTANDAGDADGGANNGQNFPVLTIASESTSEGTLNSTPSTTFRIEVFANAACDASGHGEGEQVVGTTNVTTTPSGTARFRVPVRPASGKSFLTATATNTATGDTSEFAACRRINRAPTAQPDSYGVKAGTPRTVAAPGVLANDTDPDGDALSASIHRPPTSGTVTVNPNGAFTYTPNAGFTGTDSFIYRVSDRNGNITTAVVTLTVGPNQPPQAQNDTYTTPPGEVLEVAAPGVLANDTDSQGDALSASLVTTPAQGRLTFNPTGAFTYTPNAGFIGTDSFRYVANDGAFGVEATVTIRVGEQGGVVSGGIYVPLVVQPDGGGSAGPAEGDAQPTSP